MFVCFYTDIFNDNSNLDQCDDIEFKTTTGKTMSKISYQIDIGGDHWMDDTELGNPILLDNVTSPHFNVHCLTIQTKKNQSHFSWLHHSLT